MDDIRRRLDRVEKGIGEKPNKVDLANLELQMKLEVNNDAASDIKNEIQSKENGKFN